MLDVMTSSDPLPLKSSDDGASGHREHLEPGGGRHVSESPDLALRANTDGGIRYFCGRPPGYFPSVI